MKISSTIDKLNKIIVQHHSYGISSLSSSNAEKDVQTQEKASEKFIIRKKKTDKKVVLNKK